MLGEGRASGVVNAVLRRFVAQRAELLADVDADLAQRHAHPRWLVTRCTAWASARKKSSPPTMNIRRWCCGVDPAQLHAEDFLRSGARSGAMRARWNGAPMRSCSSGRSPCRHCPVSKPARVSVQDGGAQLAAPLLDASRYARARCLRRAGRQDPAHRQRTPALAELVAVDDDVPPGARRENLDARGRDAVLLDADLRTPAPVPRAGVFRSRAGGRAVFGDGCDPPSSGHQTAAAASDIEAFAATQRKILATAFELLRPGGRLRLLHLFVIPAENEEVVAAFLRDSRAPRR